MPKAREGASPMILLGLAAVECPLRRRPTCHLVVRPVRYTIRLADIATQTVVPGTRHIPGVEERSDLSLV